LPSSSRLSKAEQSNSSIFFEDSLILKLFRHIQPGINPDVEIGRFLTEQAGFEHTPVYAGEIRYQTKESDSEPSDMYVLALLQGQVKNQGDGWSWTLSQLQSIGDPSSTEHDASGYAPAASLLALRTAQMHDALEKAAIDGMRSRPATREDLAADALRLKAQMSSTLLLLKHQFSDLPDSYVEEAAALIARRREMETFVEVLASISPEQAGRWMRIHGDYHLGQVLRTDSDFVILDFEGEPLKPLEERRRLQSPLRDVAGMIRSFDYVAAVHGQEAPEASSWLPAWERSTKSAYLDTYLRERNLMQRDGIEMLLKAYELEKALYELQYELSHRPTWTHIPLRATLEIISSV
jgi:maltose alpha-D-glucosyltransferase/alpha-amylase